MSSRLVILMLMVLSGPLLSSPEPLDLGSNKSGSRARFGVNTIPKKNKVSKYIFCSKKKHLPKEKLYTVEAGVQGVQLHTHFLAPFFGKQSSFVWKNLGLLDKLHTHIYYLPPPLSKHNHYGADCICRSCRGFFMRAVQRNFYQKFQHDNDCIIDSQNRKSCKK